MIIEFINWKFYEDFFPERYIKEGEFDQVVAKVIRKYKPKTILDVGGGKYGTGVLTLNAKLWMLDPYVAPPSGFKRWQLQDFDTHKNFMFDLIVARGSINYLTIHEIVKITTHGRTFLANSFKNPPSRVWTERSYQTIDGTPGIERVRLTKHNIVEHEVIIQNRKIVHSFIYYSIKDFETMIPGVKIIPYGESSILLRK